MGRYRAESNENYGRKSEKGRKINTTSSDESDLSSYLSDLEDSSVDKYDNRDRRNSKTNMKVDDWTLGNDHSGSSSDSDSSYNPTKRKSHVDSYRERMKSKSGSKSRSCYGDSDSDESSSHKFERSTLKRHSNDRTRRASRKQSQRRSAYGVGVTGDKKSDDRRTFSSRIGRIRREHEESSFNSNEDSESDIDSSRSSRSSHGKPRGSGSNSNLVEPPQRSLRSRKQSTRSMSQNSSTLNPSFNSQGQIQTSVPTGNNLQLMPSTSVRSMRSIGLPFFSGEQSPATGVLVNKSIVDQGQGQGHRTTDISNHNIQGHTNPRLPLGPGNMIRSVSARSMKSYSTGQLQLNRSSQSVIAQAPIQASPAITRVNSQRSLVSNNFLQDTSIQRQVPMRGASTRSLGNVLSSPSVYQQQPGLRRVQSKSSLGNNALLNSPRNCQRPRLVIGASKGSLGNNDGFHNTTMHSQQPGLIRVASQNSLAKNETLLNNKSMNPQYPGRMGGPSQRSLGNNNALLNASSIQSNPNVRMDTTRQPHTRTNNSNRAVNRTEAFSATADSVLVMSGALEDITVLASKSLRNSLPQSLADQIYSRIQSRHGDTESFGSFADPPGEDSNRWNRRSVELLSDDSSYDSLREDQDSYVASNDPPDMFDDNRNCSDVSGDKLEPYEGRGDDRQDFSNKEDSNTSGFGYNVVAYGRKVGDSVSDSCANSNCSFSDRKNERSPGKSHSRFSSELAFEYGQQTDPPQSISSFKLERVAVSNKKENDNKKKVDNTATTPHQASRSWLAQQISIRKSMDTNVGSRYLEPKGASTHEQMDSSTKKSAPENKSNRREKLELNENSSLPSEIDYILHHKASSAVLNSSGKTYSPRSDDSTTTTDTMTRDAPSTIISIKDLCTDFDSLPSTSDDESSRGASDVYKSEKKRNDSLLRFREKRVAKSSKKSHIDASSRIYTHLKDTNPRKNDVLREAKKRTDRATSKENGTKKNLDAKTKFSKKKEGYEEERNKYPEKTSQNDGACSISSAPSDEESQNFGRRLSPQPIGAENSSETKTETSRFSRSPGTRKPEKTRNFTTKRERDEKLDLEDESVMSLINKLKAFEFDQD